MAVRIFKDTTSPSLTDTIQVNGTAYDLTGCSVKLQMRAVGSSTLVIDAAATVVTAASGSVRYDWVAGDVDTVGDYLAWWRVTLPSTKTQDTAEFLVEIVDHAPTTSPALCTVHEVREWMQKPGEDRDQDAVIENVIVRASRAIITYTGREFIAFGSQPATRVFDLAGQADIRKVRIGDMASAPTAVVIIGEDASTVATLTVGTDVQAYPLVRWPWEPVTELRLRVSAGVLSSRHQLSVTGTFGWPSVPEDVTQAAIITAASWVRRHVQAFSTSYAVEAVEDGAAPESIPLAARALLHQHRERVIA